jgi:hypothetical protein
MCPNCGKFSLCGCGSCSHGRKGSLPRLRTQSYKSEPDGIKCPYCRVTLHPDQWLDAEWEAMKEKELIKQTV